MIGLRRHCEFSNQQAILGNLIQSTKYTAYNNGGIVSA